MRASHSLVVAALMCGACSSTPDALATDGCDPLVPDVCGFPFPSNAWLVDDAKTPTGHHVQFGKKTLPPQRSKATDPTPWTRSRRLLARHDADDLVARREQHRARRRESSGDVGDGAVADDPPRRAAPAQLVPHFAELDMSAARRRRARLHDPPGRAAQGRDAATSSPSATSSTTPAQPIAPSPGVPGAARRHAERPTPRSSAAAPLYADIFAQLDDGRHRPRPICRSRGTTRPRAARTTRARMLAMRDEALAIVGDAGAELHHRPTSIENPNPHIRRRIHGTMTVPLYLDKPDARRQAAARRRRPADAERLRRLPVPRAHPQQRHQRHAGARSCRTATACSARRTRARTATWPRSATPEELRRASRSTWSASPTTT